MRSQILGETLPVLEVELQPGEVLVAETGQLSWMAGGIELHTTTNTGGASGFLGALTRAVSGGGLFMTEFTAPYGPGVVAFAAKIPGRIREIQVQPGQGYLMHKHGFICGMAGIQVGTGLQQSIGAGLFGGNGFILQRISGAGTAWVELGGEVIERELAPGETVRVHPGHVGMFEDRVGFSVTPFRGIRNLFFGGDGLFLAELTGPGRVWLQTLTLPNLAHALAPYLSNQPTPPPKQDTTSELGLAGEVLRGFLSRG